MVSLACRLYLTPESECGLPPVCLMYNGHHYDRVCTKPCIASSLHAMAASPAVSGGGGGSTDAQGPNDEVIWHKRSEDQQDQSNLISVAFVRRKYRWNQAFKAAPVGFHYITPAGLDVAELRRLIATKLRVGYEFVHIYRPTGGGPA